MRCSSHAIGSNPLQAAHWPHVMLQWRTTSSPTFQRVTPGPIFHTTPLASLPAMWKSFFVTSSVDTGLPSPAQMPL